MSKYFIGMIVGAGISIVSSLMTFVAVQLFYGDKK